ncbi:pseudouridine synthase, partial [Escherichia coli]
YTVAYSSAASDVYKRQDHILVLNKPSGTAVHGGSGLSFGVIEGLRALRPEARFLELVHRLDRDTSGVLLVAKKRSALR